MNKIEMLMAAEIAKAEEVANTAITALEIPTAPKVRLLTALAWVWFRRDNREVSFKDFADTHTMEQVTSILGLNDGEAESEKED